MQEQEGDTMSGDVMSGEVQEGRLMQQLVFELGFQAGLALKADSLAGEQDLVQSGCVVIGKIATKFNVADMLTKLVQQQTLF